MKRALLTGFTLFVGTLTGLVFPAPASAAGTLSLKVSGNQLVDASGSVLHLHGVNRSGTEYACVQNFGPFDGPSDAASIQAIASWHVNIVRVLLNEDCWLGINGAPNGGYTAAAYQQAIADYVSLLHQNGMYAELSLIWAAPGTNLATNQPGAPDEDHSPALWSSLAAAYKNDPAVVLAPWGETIVDANCFLNGGVCEATYGSSNTPYNTAGMQQAVNLMRAAGYNGPIAIPCLTYANDCTQWLSHKPSDPQNQLVAEAHIYGKNVCGDPTCFNSQLLPVAQSVPMIWGEAGETYDGSDCGSSIAAVNFPWAMAHTSGLEAWTWDTWNSCDALIADYQGTPTSGYGSWVKSYYAQLAAGGLPVGAWEDQGGVLASQPAVSTWGSGRLDVFVLGGDGQIWHRFLNAGAWQWEALNGLQATSAASAVSTASGHLDVFARGADGALWHVAFNGTAWGGWVRLGGVLGAAPSAVSIGNGTIDVFVQGTDNHLWLWSSTPSPSGTWSSIGGVLAGRPAGVSASAGTADAFMEGADGQLWRWASTPSPGGTWSALGGRLQTSPAAASSAAGVLDVLVEGTDTALWHWSNARGWELVGGRLSAAPSATSWGSGRLDVAVDGTDAHLYHAWSTGGGWYWESLGGVLSGSPAAISWGANRVELFVRGTDNHLWHLPLG